MKRKTLHDVIISEKSSIKDAMRKIDHSGLRVVFVVNGRGAVIGALSDSEIRKAILKGKDVKSPAKSIVNENPIVFREKDLSSGYTVKKVVEMLLKKMPDSRYMLVVDDKDIPKDIMPCSLLLGQKGSPRGDNERKDGEILVVGGAGYLGSVLVRKLLERMFTVKVLDNIMYGIGPIEPLLSHDRFKFIEGDARNISVLVKALNNVDAVINLAAIVGDPACTNKPESAIETNYLANKILAEACKFHQVNRFIYASTCSVYGTMDGEKELDENSALNPVSLYARSKIQSEEGILSIEDENFSPTILRMGTLYGYSPRMRFDLVVNSMVKNAIVDKKIFIHGGGRQWRPLVNLEDAAEAYIKCLEAPLKRIKGEIFNVGSGRQNFQIIEIGRITHALIPGARLVIEEGKTDQRNYVVSFSKIEKRLDYRATRKLEDSILYIKKAIENGEIADVNDPKYYNVESNP